MTPGKSAGGPENSPGLFFTACGARFRLVTDCSRVLEEARARLSTWENSLEAPPDFSLFLAVRGGALERESGSVFFLETPRHATLYVSEDGEAGFDPAARRAMGRVAPAKASVHETGDSLVLQLVLRALAEKGTLPLDAFPAVVNGKALLLCGGDAGDRARLALDLKSPGMEVIRCSVVCVFPYGDTPMAEGLGAEGRGRAFPLAALVFLENARETAARPAPLDPVEIRPRLAACVHSVADAPLDGALENLLGRIVRLPCFSAPSGALSGEPLRELFGRTGAFAAEDLYGTRGNPGLA